jgi:aminoglycoside 6'-N-acetyltransferase
MNSFPTDPTRMEPGLVGVRAMRAADLELVAVWLRAPHVARWWTEDPDDEIAGYQRALAGVEPTVAMMITVADRAIGWCQWYRWADYPPAGDYGAGEGDVGIDYAIGEPDWVGRGVGTAMIAALVAQIGRVEPAAAILASVDVANTASRRILEHNGFVLVDERAIASEPEELSALYRLERSGAAH